MEREIVKPAIDWKLKIEKGKFSVSDGHYEFQASSIAGLNKAIYAGIMAINRIREEYKMTPPLWHIYVQDNPISGPCVYYCYYTHDQTCTIDEDEKAAISLGGILTSAMLAAHGAGLSTPRTQLYVWEREGLQWLIRFRERRPDGSIGNDWIRTFIDLNRDMILSDGGRIDFNLKAYDERKWRKS